MNLFGGERVDCEFSGVQIVKFYIGLALGLALSLTSAPVLAKTVSEGGMFSGSERAGKRNDAPSFDVKQIPSVPPVLWLYGESSYSGLTGVSRKPDQPPGVVDGIVKAAERAKLHWPTMDMANYGQRRGWAPPGAGSGSGGTGSGWFRRGRRGPDQLATAAVEQVRVAAIHPYLGSSAGCRLADVCRSWQSGRCTARKTA